MSRFVVITQPDLADGFRLAGVETFAINEVEEVEKIDCSLAGKQR